MIDFNQTQIKSIAIHRVGSKSREDELQLSSEPTTITDEATLHLLKTFFLYPFKQPVFYSFTHDVNIQHNDICKFASRAFDNPLQLHEQSIHMAQHLHEVSGHPNIKFGELYVVLFEGCVIDGELVDALGIFKSESKENFLKVYQTNTNVGVDAQEGISINKLDKGCLIFNTEKDLGYKLMVHDKTSANAEERFWRESFLNAAPRQDDFYQTQEHINVCKGFVRQVYNPENRVERADQVEMLNKTRDFFAEKENFDIVEFEREVIKEPEVIEAFRDYKEAYQSEMGCNLKDSFSISVDAAKQAKKVLKSVIKLDKNFHLYIHGDREKVERGFDDEKRMNYYKLYYNNEA